MWGSLGSLWDPAAAAVPCMHSGLCRLPSGAVACVACAHNGAGLHLLGARLASMGTSTLAGLVGSCHTPCDSQAAPGWRGETPASALVLCDAGLQGCRRPVLLACCKSRGARGVFGCHDGLGGHAGRVGAVAGLVEVASSQHRAARSCGAADVVDIGHPGQREVHRVRLQRQPQSGQYCCPASLSAGCLVARCVQAAAHAGAGVLACCGD